MGLYNELLEIDGSRWTADWREDLDRMRIVEWANDEHLGEVLLSAEVLEMIYIMLQRRERQQINLDKHT